jgi:hypothetical protein
MFISFYEAALVVSVIGKGKAQGNRGQGEGNQGQGEGNRSLREARGGKGQSVEG